MLLLRETLEEIPCIDVVDAVCDGEQALSLLRREGRFANTARPSLVLLDINMPRMNGLEVLAEMKADSTLRTIPVVMFTTSSRDTDVQHAYSMGASSFIKKPVNFDRLKFVACQLAEYWTTVVQIPGTAGD
ncbi:MAG: response regulator [Planctomycetes bacterium]|nr:response regulator [Planctomycetota bacterium]